MHKSVEDKTADGGWSWLTLIGKNNKNMIYITCYRVCPCRPIHLIGSAYYQQYRIMEQENESRLLPIDPNRQTIHDLHIFILQHLQDASTVSLAKDGNESDAHLFCSPSYSSRLTTPLGFNFDSRISGSIATILEACELVNSNTLQHGEAPATHKQGSRQIDFMLISRSLVRNVKGCGILSFDSMLPSEHIPLYVDFDVATLFGHPSIGTEKAAL
jgi:hypothetical protein